VLGGGRWRSFLGLPSFSLCSWWRSSFCWCGQRPEPCSVGQYLQRLFPCSDAGGGIEVEAQEVAEVDFETESTPLLPSYSCFSSLHHRFCRTPSPICLEGPHSLSTVHSPLWGVCVVSHNFSMYAWPCDSSTEVSLPSAHWGTPYPTSSYLIFQGH